MNTTPSADAATAQDGSTEPPTTPIPPWANRAASIIRAAVDEYGREASPRIDFARIMAREAAADDPAADLVETDALDAFSALADVAEQLAEAASIPAALRGRVAKIVDDARQNIARERAFAQALGRINRDAAKGLAMIGDAMAPELIPQKVLNAITPGRPILGPAFQPSAE